MMLLSASLLALLACPASARRCRDIDVHVSVTARNALFSLDTLTTEVGVTDFYLNLARQGSNYTEQLLEGFADVSGDFTLATTYCEPDDGPGSVLQLMTHGVGFDRSYWDLPLDHDRYSYVARAVDDQGYSTLTWDRLGIGASSKVHDTVNGLQIYLEIEALRALTELAAGGCLDGVDRAYDTIVHLGHSFGSAMTYDLVNRYPHLSSAVVLTGFSQVPDFMAYFALGGNFVPVASVPFLVGRYPEGYVGAGSRTGVQTNFFGPGDFDPDVLSYMYRHAQPNTPGEILTVGAGSGEPNVFDGPVMIITGERDVPFCGGSCSSIAPVGGSAPNLIEASAPMFPNASPFNATVVPRAGHGLSLGYSSAGAFDKMLDFIGAHV